MDRAGGLIRQLTDSLSLLGEGRGEGAKLSAKGIFDRQSCPSTTTLASL